MYARQKPWHRIASIMSLLITVVWGTKARTRALGVRADFCTACAEVRKFMVYTIEKSDHIYLISIGGWSENLRYQECEVCHAQRQIPPEARLLAVDEAETRPVGEVLEATNSPGGIAAVREAEQSAQSIPPEQKKQSALTAFLTQQAAQLKQSEESTGGWAGLLFLLFIGPGVAVFMLGGLEIGIAASVGLVILLLWIQTRMIHRAAEAVIEPRLPKFLEGTGMTGKDFVACLRREPGVPGKLLRHFRRFGYRRHLR